MFSIKRWSSRILTRFYVLTRRRQTLRGANFQLTNRPKAGGCRPRLPPARPTISQERIVNKNKIPQEQINIKPLPTRVCPRPGCYHGGQPQPAKYFNGKGGVKHDTCRDCRWGRNRRRPDSDFNGYGPPRDRPFILPPGCEIGPAPAVCGAGEGVPILTDPKGRPVVKRVAGLGPREVCYVVR